MSGPTAKKKRGKTKKLSAKPLMDAIDAYYAAQGKIHRLAENPRSTLDDFKGPLTTRKRKWNLVTWRFKRHWDALVGGLQGKSESVKWQRTDDKTVDFREIGEKTISKGRFRIKDTVRYIEITAKVGLKKMTIHMWTDDDKIVLSGMINKVKPKKMK